jgi:CheY-like chemotaxis protein
MAITVVLAVCLDPLHLGTQGAVWGSKGYVFLAANSVNEAINHFKAGDFDLVLLGQSIPADAGQRLTSLIRATGSHVPVVSIAGSSGRHDFFADATFEHDSHDSNELLIGVGELLKSKAKMRRAGFQYDTAT